MSENNNFERFKREAKAVYPHIDKEKFVLLPLEIPPGMLEYDESPDERIRRLGSPTTFSNETLCAAICNKCSLETIKWYIQSYQGSGKSNELLSKEGWPALYYAAERNSGDLVTVLLQYGVDAKSNATTFFVPLIAYAIIHGHIKAIDTSEVVKLLLAAGYDPTTVPMDMWFNYLESPTKSPNSTVKVSKEALKSCAWCTPSIRKTLAQCIHLTHRYLLRLAHELASLRPRMLQIAKVHKMTEMSKLPYFLIGQRPATDIVMKHVYSHIALSNRTPLVMAFAGPSGHGKTELAKAMGELLSVKTVVIDMAACRYVVALFGSNAGYQRSEDGSKLNNFLAANSGKRSVVFLDEFDKTDQEIRNALLLMTQSGEYEDRRYNTAVDCTQTIWIVATNLGDNLICKYYTRNLERLDEKARNTASMKVLQATLKHEYRTRFGAPFTGRINLIVPFLPFTKSECAVVLHKFILQFATNIRQPIDMQPDVNRLVGHCRLSIIEDGNVCVTLTEQYYNQDLGARSLANAVKEVEHELTTEYCNIEQLITEDINDGPVQCFTVSRRSVADDEYEVVVSAGGLGGFEIGDSDDNEDSEDMLQYDKVEGGAQDEKLGYTSGNSDDDMPIWRIKRKGAKKSS